MSDPALQLDARRLAMLEEMGVKLVGWRPAGSAPAAAAAAEPRGGSGATAVLAHGAGAARIAPPARAPAAAAPAAPATAPPAVSAPDRPAAVPAAGRRLPVASATEGALLAEAPRLLCGDPAGTAQGGWLIVADMPPEPGGRQAEPFDGEAGRLLYNMLAALQLHGGSLPVHLVRTYRGARSERPDGPRPLAEALTDGIPALAPRVLLALGQLPAQHLLQSAEPLGRLRGRVLRPALAGLPPLVASYHPAYLLRNPADKARAWADLCLAAEQLAD